LPDWLFIISIFIATILICLIFAGIAIRNLVSEDR
jgi:hypothetical protein